MLRAMTTSTGVTLEPATRADAELLSNMLELYIHDLSTAWRNLELGPSGRYGYDKLDLYWSEPGRRWAFVVRCERRIAGFVLAMRGSPMLEDPEVLDVCEFFVLRSYRRASVGQRAAQLLWRLMPGRWVVRCSEGNEGALPFWRSAVAEASGGTAVETQRPGMPHAWRVFSFETNH
jgi:predicted acetyltransferase